MAINIKVDDCVQVSRDQAERYKQPFREWISAGHSAVVTYIATQCQYYTRHAEVAFSADQQDRILVATKYLKKAKSWRERGGAMTDTLKAYIVTTEENTGGVIYAHTTTEARRWGADEYNEGESAGMSCCRAPELDDRQHDKRAEVEYLLAHGWWFESAHIGGDTLTDDDNPFVTREGEVYRTPYQWLATAEADAIEQANTRRFHEWAESKWWYAEDLHVSGDGLRGYAVTLRLPHLRYSVVWQSAAPDSVGISPPDLLTWRALYNNDFLGLKDQLPNRKSSKTDRMGDE